MRWSWYVKQLPHWHTATGTTSAGKARRDSHALRRPIMHTWSTKPTTWWRRAWARLVQHLKNKRFLQQTSKPRPVVRSQKGSTEFLLWLGLDFVLLSRNRAEGQPVSLQQREQLRGYPVQPVPFPWNLFQWTTHFYLLPFQKPC